MQLRIAFFIQGEGRGHMTQALALKRILDGAGHQVVAAFMGENPHRPVPDFFRRGLDAPLHTYRAPYFVLDRKGRGIRPFSSFLQGLAHAPTYWAEGPRLHALLQAHDPHLLVNFYDLLGGLYYSLYRPPVPMVAVGHQFLFFHPHLPTPQDQRWEVETVRLHTRATAPGAALRLGLSFSPLADRPDYRLRVVPPLLREAVLSRKPTPGDHVLAYVLNPGYGEELSRWHASHREVEVHCFWDKKDAPVTLSPRDGFTFHRLDDRKFLDYLASCRAYVSTAGFESVCEAAYLGKPVMVVPTGKHVEQLCNALDAQRAGIAEWSHAFHLSSFLEGLGDSAPSPDTWFRRWVRSAPEIFLRLLEGTARGEHPMGIPLPEDPS